jgi:hypothetical protein
MLLAIRSDKGPVEDQKYIFSAAKIGQPDGPASEIGETEIRRGRVNGNAWHC